MATQLQIRRGTAAQVAAFTGAEGEIVYNSTNDSLHTNDGSTAGGFELARADGSNFSSSISFTTLSAGTLNVSGAAAFNTEITANGGIALGDNDKATFGAGDDLQIYHDGSNSYIKDLGTGNLAINTNGSEIMLTGQNGSEYMIRAIQDGAVELYHNAVKKLATTASGIDVTGLVAADSLTVDNFTLDGTTLALSSGDFTLDIQGDINFDAGGGDFKFKDGGTEFGRIFQSSSNMYIKSTVSDANIVFQGNDGGSSTSVLTLDMSAAGAATFNAGATFNGTATMDGLTVSSTTPVIDVLAATNEDASLRLRESGTGIVGAEFTYDGGDNALYLKVGNNSDTKRLSVSRDTGDISFFEDQGVTPKFFWDSSAESLGIGTSSWSSANTYMDDLVVYNDTAGTGAGISIIGNATNGYSSVAFGDTADWDVGRIQYSHANNSMTFRVNTSDALTIDSSGNLLVGTSNTTWQSQEGLRYFNGSSLIVTRDGDEPMSLNRLTNDGDLLVLRQNGTTVGSIGVQSSDNFYIDATTGGGAGLLFWGSGGADPFITPREEGAEADARVGLGRYDLRFTDLYLSGGVYLGGTSAAHKLEDYEEGEFALVLSGTVTAGTNSGGSRGGLYTKIGRLVTCQVMVANTTLSGAAGVLKFSGLPFTPAGYATRGFRGVVSTYGQNLFSPADGYFSPAIDIVHNSTDFYLLQTKDDGNWANVLVDNQSGLYFEGSVSYFTND